MDVFGGLEKSIEIAAEMAGLENYRLVSRPELEDPFTALMKQITGESIKSRILEKELDDSYHMYKKVQEIKDIQGVQAIMPYTIQIH